MVESAIDYPHQAGPDLCQKPSQLAALWLHESERVYADRLVSTAVRVCGCARAPPLLRPPRRTLPVLVGCAAHAFLSWYYYHAIFFSRTW